MGLTMCVCDNKIKNDLVNDDLMVNVPNNNSSNNNLITTPETGNNGLENKEEKENENVKENKKEKKEDDILSVNSIIPEQKLHSKNNNEIMFIGDLQNNENKNEISSFATLTRLKLNFYKDKAQFISMKRPIYSLNLNQMLNADLIKNNDNKLLLCITLLENEEKKIFETKTKELLFKWLCVLNYFIPLSQVN